MNKQTPPHPLGRIRQTGPYDIVYKIVLRRLQTGEEVCVGDWCCDPRSPQPVEIIFRTGPHPISESHHPHYRIEIKRIVNKPRGKVGK